MAAARASALDLEVTCSVAPAEDSGLATGFFDAVTASQCWGYLDHSAATADISRVLAPGGLLAILHLSWLPSASPIVRATEALLVKAMPSWSSGGWDGGVLETLPGAEALDGVARFIYDEELPFTRESWRGRIRASRPIGATLSAGDVRRFDGEHAALLEGIAPERFTIRHRISAHIYRTFGGVERSHASNAA